MGEPAATKRWDWGHLLHHDGPCPDCDGCVPDEDEDECPTCDGDLSIRWGSFYANDVNVCHHCDSDEEVPICSGDGHAWTCLPCYLRAHRVSCGCLLWIAAEHDVLGGVGDG